MEATRRQIFARLIVSAWSTLLQFSTKIWDGWGIQLLVTGSFFCQVYLVHFGGRRRYYYKKTSRFFIWASYLLASNLATIALGKLTVITIRNPENPEYNVELLALLAPLLLMHLGNPDCISAYSVEDTHMGLRDGLKLLIHIVFVIWVLIRCFDNSSLVSMFLYIPLLIAGIIEPLSTIFTLLWVYDDTTSVDELNEIKESISLEKGKRPEGAPGCLHHVLMAYHRFDCLRPHRVNWIYHSKFVENNWMSVEALEPEDAFHVTELELGFVYDAIYTQSPMVCTKKGLVSRTISISCLVLALCGFSIIFRSAFLLDSYVAYTYAILTGSIIMELYQMLTLPFSYTAVIAFWKWSRNLRHSQRQRCESKSYEILEFLDRVCKSQKFWSESMGQLNLVEYCLKDIFIPKPVRFILGKVHPEAEKKVKKFWRSTHWRDPKTVTSHLKVEIIKKLRKLEQKIKITSFEHIRLWTLQDLHIDTNDTRKRKAFYLDEELGKCIIIWHITTDILLLHSFNNNVGESSTIGCCCGPSSSLEKEKLMLVSELLSKYMMYLLVDHPYLLSLTTSDVTIGYASSVLQALAKEIGVPIYSCTLQDKNRQQLLDAIKKGQTVNYKNQYETFITGGWHVLEHVKELLTELEKLDDCVKWELISGVWIDMLCYAARKSQVYQHMKMLRKGGELITHVWLLLLHKTDKFPYEEEKPKQPTPVV